jgi:hypothetical protein
VPRTERLLLRALFFLDFVVGILGLFSLIVERYV